MASKHYPSRLKGSILTDLHVHSIYSVKKNAVRFFWKYDSSCTPEAIIRKALLVGLSGVAVTDHNSVKGGIETRRFARSFASEFIVVVGEEISTSEGHMLALGVEDDVPSHRSAAETIDLIHDQGGLAVAAHPFHPNPWLSLRQRVRNLSNLDGIEAFNSYNFARGNNLAQKVAQEIGKPVTGGSDAHIEEMIGNGLTILPDSCYNSEDVLDAIKRAKSQASGRTTNIGTILQAYLRKIALTWL